MQPIRRLLLNLDSVKATYLFLAALVAASFSIVFNVGIPAIPIAAVLLYGLALLASSHWYFVAHSEMTKNSPYFLAFLLFLVALYSLFRDAGTELRQAVILPRLGAALLPTIFGLSFRQLLFAVDPSQRDHDAFYRTVEEELKRNAVEFKKAQVQLVDLVKEFTETRQSMLSAEETAARDYITHMHNAVAVFEDTAAAYPKAVLEAITALNKRLTAVVQKLDQAVQTTGSIDLAAVSTASAALRGFATELTDTTLQFNEVKTTTQMVIRDLATLGSGVEQLVKSTHGTIEQSNRALVNGISDSLTSLKLLIQNEHAIISNTAQPIKDDLQAIDKILTDFIKLLNTKVLAAANGGSL